MGNGVNKIGGEEIVLNMSIVSRLIESWLVDLLPLSRFSNGHLIDHPPPSPDISGWNIEHLFRAKKSACES